ncbi:hypothetical protein FQN57_002682 [Myotisia sp. PD_48]|nr:hypothetical protein FQN57_002682 [Myotisia sp. PD_48]
MANLFRSKMDLLWSSLVSTYSPLQIEFIGTLCVQLAAFWLPCAIYIGLDIWAPAFSQHHKLQPASKQPTAAEIYHCFVYVLKNQLLTTGIHILQLTLSFTFGLIPPAYNVVAPLPSLIIIARDVALCLLIREILFYYTHRLLHHPYFYARIHKRHHQFTAPISLAAQYAHPIEQLVANVLPISVPPQLLHSHIVTAWVFFIIELFKTVTVHSGYDFFGGEAKMHDLHHEKFNLNYGSRCMSATQSKDEDDDAMLKKCRTSPLISAKCRGKVGATLDERDASMHSRQLGFFPGVTGYGVAITAVLQAWNMSEDNKLEAAEHIPLPPDEVAQINDWSTAMTEAVIATAVAGPSPIVVPQRKRANFVCVQDSAIKFLKLAGARDGAFDDVVHHLPKVADPETASTLNEVVQERRRMVGLVLENNSVAMLAEVSVWLAYMWGVAEIKDLIESRIPADLVKPEPDEGRPGCPAIDSRGNNALLCNDCDGISGKICKMVGWVPPGIE